MPRRDTQRLGVGLPTPQPCHHPTKHGTQRLSVPAPCQGVHPFPTITPDPNRSTPRRGTTICNMGCPRLDHVSAYSTLLGDKQPLKFGVGSLYSSTLMASSSAPASIFDEHRFRKEFNQQLFESHARRRKVIPEVGFNLDEDKYPQIMEQILLRVISDEEAANKDELPYKIFVRGVKVDFSPNNIRRVMRFKREIVGVETDYKTRQAIDQRLDEVLADLCIPGATWKLSSGQLAVPIQLRRTELHPLAKGWGEEVGAEEIIADNMEVIAQGLQNKGNLAFPSTIYKLCKDAGVPLREFRRTSKIPEESYITTKRMESTRIPRNLPQQQEDDDEDEPMPQAGGGNDEEEEQQQQHDHQQPPH
ncbi:hypothetical protein PIB30_082931 [Stylosanthes scabra]|uniref:Putative plant transposon protein domain-containing protein n=1 Tax=Stylosanthes scabra TaxID=79078 RepID=A0ABU6VRU2_9FABA|nr:hypothetical protein [Stylosanthes scabra]